jgi:tetratricopeptide (TPR) repeat protein
MKKVFFRALGVIVVVSAIFLADTFLLAHFYGTGKIASPVSGGKPGTSGSVSTQDRENQLLEQLTKTLAAIAPQQDSDGDYFLKRLSDLITSPLFIAAVVVAVVFREEFMGVLSGLQALKVGPLEVGLTSIEKVKIEMSEWNLKLTTAGGAVGQLVTDLADLETYPRRKIERTLDQPFFDLDWSSIIPMLRLQEARLTSLDDRLRSLPYFKSKRPPDDFIEAKSKLFTLYLRIGNLYGFARLQNPIAGLPVDLKTSEFYLERAINLKPEIGQERENTLGYANFCSAAVKGLLGLELLGGNAPGQQAAGRPLVREAIKALKKAEDNDYSPPILFHLRGTLFFYLDDFGEAEKSWRQAATQSESPKMYFNWACMLSKLGKYTEALTQLEQAIKIWDDLFPGRPAGQPFDPRAQAIDQAAGEEFRPFWSIPPDPAAAAARSTKTNRSFNQIVA